jgi:hypothetical protein
MCLLKDATWGCAFSGHCGEEVWGCQACSGLRALPRPWCVQLLLLALWCEALQRLSAWPAPNQGMHAAQDVTAGRFLLMLYRPHQGAGPVYLSNTAAGPGQRSLLAVRGAVQLACLGWRHVAGSAACAP